MKLSKLIKMMVFITVLSLVYIHMQMQIFDLAYQGKNKEKFIRQLREVNGNYTYDILKLKSAMNLGDKLLDENSDLKFLDKTNVVKFQMYEKSVDQREKVLLSKPVQKPNLLLSIFSLSSQAEARPQE